MNRNLYYDISGTWILLTYILVVSNNMIGPTYMGWVDQILIFGSLLFICATRYAKEVPRYIWGLVFLMVFSTFVHFSNPDYQRPIQTTAHWIFLIFFFVIALQYYKGKWLLYLIIAFFIINCSIGCYERLTLSRFLTYDISMLEIHESVGEQGATFFRSFALLGHPLYNANVTSLIMAFILVSDKIGKYKKTALILLGLMGLISFNSRASMLIWGLILVFYYTSKYKYSFIILSILVLLFVAQPIISFFVDNELVGRLGEGLDDSSTETRWLCYAVFGAQEWNMSSRLGGLGTIYYPYSEVSLENGVLLTLGYWGWYAGGYKVIAELVLTYKALKKKYDFTKIIVIFLASWGVAFCNNNTFIPIFLSFLAITTIAFNSYGMDCNNRK